MTDAEKAQSIVHLIDTAWKLWGENAFNTIRVRLDDLEARIERLEAKHKVK